MGGSFVVDVSIEDLVLAYRRAKVDLYYRDEPRLADLVKYESSLTSELLSLQRKLRSEDSEWITQDEFVGGFTLMPTAIADPPTSRGGLIWSDPREAWGRQQDDGPRPRAQFRAVSHCSVSMHVLSTLWLMLVGDRLDAALTESAYGSRLRRTRTNELNRFAPSSFKNYAHPYRRWRDGALGAIETALQQGRSVVALTADATAFYHHLDASFLTDERFLSDAVGIDQLDSESQELHRLFVRALQAWADGVSAATGWAARGLPVGLPASAVVANVALIELDRLVAQQVKPVFYGRYVDDIILVIEDGDHLRDSEQIWDWIIERSGGRFVREVRADSRTERSAIRFDPGYLGASDVIFDNEKNKIFHLEGSNGRFVVETLRRTIDSNTSAWRALPEISEDAEGIGSKIVTATTEDGQSVATLRDADRLSARRAAFAIALRDFEAYERDLDLGSWFLQRDTFFRVVDDHVVRDPAAAFAFARYLPRILKLASACADWESLRRLIGSTVDTFNLLTAPDSPLEWTADFEVKGYLPDGESEEARGAANRSTVAVGWAKWLYLIVRQSVAAGYPGGAEPARLAAALAPLSRLPGVDQAGDEQSIVREVEDLHLALYLADLAHAPFRNVFLMPELAAQRGVPLSDWPNDQVSAVPKLPDKISSGLNLLGDRLIELGYGRGLLSPDRDGSSVPGLAFATRPFDPLELYLLLQPIDGGFYPYRRPGEISQMLLALRGYQLSDGGLPHCDGADDGHRRTITVADEQGSGAKTIGLGMLETSEDNVIAAALGRSNLTRARYQEISRLLNTVLALPQPPDYLLLPELSVPPRWFIRFARKLQARRTNLISGIEYRRGNSADRIVRNQVWAALRAGEAGFPLHFLYSQDKQRPAKFEEKMLVMIDQLRLEGDQSWDLPPIILHGDFHLAMLVCSELTNIDYRSHLRGWIDMLFVPEWNQDLHTFDALVESAALDIHAFIAQSNSRQYGDSRIRAPASKEHERDVVRLRGGIYDYVVVGKVDYRTLREHQSLHSARNPFKPTPDGFVVAPARFRLPTQDRHWE